jgi:hypothetical protein
VARGNPHASCRTPPRRVGTPSSPPRGALAPAGASPRRELDATDISSHRDVRGVEFTAML